jgi:hypothetical protein
LRRLFATLLLALLALPAPSMADTQLVADTTASDVSSYGATFVWSRQVADGSYRLVGHAGNLTADLPVAGAPVPFDADVGPLRGTQNRVAVYSRCAGSSATQGCDVYLYDFVTRSERKLAAISRPGTSEIAPSFFKGAVAFTRRGGSRPGLYLYRPGRGAKRLTRRLASETDLAETRVVSAHVTGGRSLVRVTNYRGDDARIVARGTVNGAGEGTSVGNPVATRFNAFWLRTNTVEESAVVQRTGYNAHRQLAILTAKRELDDDVDSFAGYKIPQLYIDRLGVNRIEPKLAFGG